MKEENQIQDLIKKAQMGDEKAFTVIYELYFSPIYRFIFFKVRNREEAEDLAQTVFLKVFKSLGGFHFRDKPFSSWLYKIANNLIIDFFRKKKDLPMLEDLPEDWQIEFSDPALTPIEEAEEKELSQLARQVISELKEPDRQVLIMKYIDGSSYRDIALALNKSEEAVRQISSRSIRVVKEKFKEKGLI